jgi:hypothetical protein
MVTASAWRATGETRHLPAARLDDLIGALRADGRRVVDAVVEDGALKTAEISRAAEMPFGI